MKAHQITGTVRGTIAAVSDDNNATFVVGLTTFLHDTTTQLGVTATIQLIEDIRADMDAYKEARLT